MRCLVRRCRRGAALHHAPRGLPTARQPRSRDKWNVTFARFDRMCMVMVSGGRALPQPLPCLSVRNLTAGCYLLPPSGAAAHTRRCLPISASFAGRPLWHDAFTVRHRGVAAPGGVFAGLMTNYALWLRAM